MFLLLLSACSTISEEDRLTHFDPTAGQQQEEAADSASVAGLTKVDRNILIEDFTGQRCINCPEGTEVIEGLIAQYGEERIIPVAIHCGPFGFAGTESIQGFVTALGTAYWNHWFAERSSQPIARFNRGTSSDHIEDWSLEATKISQHTTYVSMTLSTTYDAGTRQVTVTTEAVAPEGTSCSYQLWLIEDGIVGLQKMPDGTDNYSYTHNHVLREALNGTWGETVTLGKEAKALSNAMTLPANYNAANCAIVAFLYDQAGVKQATVRRLVAD